MTTQFKYDCPHCSTRSAGFIVVYNWPGPVESFSNSLSLCGICNRGLILFTHDTLSRSHANLREGNLAFPSERFHVLEQWPENTITAPANVPENIGRFYLQGLENLRAERWDAAGAMFRKALDVATKQLDVALRSLTLFKRIEALFQAGRITEAVRDWSHEIRLDGNDAVHDEEPESSEDAEAAQKFTEAFLTYTFSLPAMVAENRSKRGKQ
jgi:hypothetical protein